MNNEQVQEIFVEDIIPNRFQPRLTFDEKALKELSDSIKIHGVIQPLVLRKVGNKYEIIAGERRYKASCMAGLKKVPAIVREMTDNESAEVALIENIQRKNLTSIEEAQSYRNLLDRGYLTQEELADKLGVSQPTIANKMRLLNLCDEVQNALLNEQISERHARSLLQLANPDDQKAMLNRVIKERLTVKQLDNEIKKVLQGVNGNNTDNNEGGAKIMEQANNDNVETVNAEKTEPRTNIFGVSLEPPTDLEATPTNLNTDVNDSIPPVSFNPFSSAPMQTNLDSVANDASTDAPLETFNIFGDVVTPNEPAAPVNPFETPLDAPIDATPTKNIGDQINRIRDAVKTTEASGFQVELEEYDFEDMYQIIIKIKK